MSLLDNAKKDVVAETKAPAKVSKGSDYQKKARAKRLASAQLIKDELTSKHIELSAEGKAALEYLCGARQASSNFGTPVFTKLFGESPKVGDKATALKVFETTGKGFAEMRKLMKQWKEKNNHIVEFDESSKSYVIKSL